MLRSVGVYGTIAYRDKKVVGVFVRFRAPLQPSVDGPKTDVNVLNRGESPLMLALKDRTSRIS
jgi:hypothetical protein